MSLQPRSACERWGQGTGESEFRFVRWWAHCRPVRGTVDRSTFEYLRRSL